jgi:hypothetical protein
MIGTQLNAGLESQRFSTQYLRLKCLYTWKKALSSSFLALYNDYTV